MLHEVDFNEILNRQNELEIENKTLKELVGRLEKEVSIKKQHEEMIYGENTNSAETIEEFSVYKFIAYLNREISEEKDKWDISKRTETALIPLTYIWEIFYLYYKPITPRAKANGLYALRNCGKKTVDELEEIILDASRKYAPFVNMNEFFHGATGTMYRALLTGFDK